MRKKLLLLLFTLVSVSVLAQTWKETTPDLKGIVYNGVHGEAADVWYAPQDGFSVKDGKDYMVTYTVAFRGAFDGNKVSLYKSTAPFQTDPSVEGVLVDDNDFSFQSGKVTCRSRVKADAAGQLYFALRLQAPADNGYAVVKDFAVSETGICGLKPVRWFKARQIEGGVELRWGNPLRDTLNARLPELIKADIYRGDALIASALDGGKPGEVGKYIDTERLTGKQTYRLLLYVNDKQFVEDEVTIDLADAQGYESLVKQFPLSTQDNFNEWTVINGNNDSYKWLFDYGAAYIQGRSTSSSADDWFISPSASLSKDKRYLLKYNVKTSLRYPSSFTVTVGDGKTAASQTQVITSVTDLEQNGYAETLFQTPQFSVEQDGDFSIAFHATKVNNQIEVKDIALFEVSAGDYKDYDHSDEALTDDWMTVEDDDDNVDLTQTRDYFLPIADEGIPLKAQVTFGAIDETTYADRGIYTVGRNGEDGAFYFSVDLPSGPELKVDGCGGIVRREGQLLVNDFSDEAYLTSIVPHLKTYDWKSLELLSDKEMASEAKSASLGLTCNALDGSIYGLMRDNMYRWIARLDVENGEFSRLSPDNLDYLSKMLCLCCDKQGDLYGIRMTEDYEEGDQTFYLCRIRKTDGLVAVVGRIQALNLLSGDVLYNMKQKQSFFINQKTGRMYWMFGGSSLNLGSTYTALFELNPVNAAATLIAYNNKNMVTSGAFLDEPSLMAPESVKSLAFKQEVASSHEGRFEVEIPSLTYGGTALSGSLYLYIAEGTDTLVRTVVTPGSTFLSDNLSLEGYSHTVNCWLENAAGESAHRSYSFSCGYDLPAYPTDITLTKDGLRTTVTWTAPIVGMHGGQFPKDLLNYTVVRYPGEITVAENIKELSFTEDHPEDMTRYCYAVYSYCGTELGQGSLSNNLIVGSPLDVPYGDIFHTAADMYNYYTILDCNKDNQTWMYDANSSMAYYNYSCVNQADDWMISPALNLLEGHEYRLLFKAYSSNSEYPETMSLYWGNTATAALGEQNLLDVLTDMDSASSLDDIPQYEYTFSPSTDGVYHYGFHVTSEANHEYLFIYDIRISDLTEGIENVSCSSQDSTTNCCNLLGQRVWTGGKGVVIRGGKKLIR